MRGVYVLAAVLLLAGCADPAPTQDEDDFDVDVEVDETTGAIRGVVVNDAVVPVAQAVVRLTGSDPRETLTDDQGRFTFSKVAPGAHFLEISKALHETVQVSAVVEAGVADPPVLRIQIPRLYSQDPFIIPKHFQGYFTCAYNLGVSSTCVNDYTRLNPTGHCPGGCFPELSSLVDHREYVTELGADWQSIQVEMHWKPSLAGTSDRMGMTVSYFDRPNAQHNWYSGSGESPMLARLDFSTHGGSEEEFNAKIPITGLPDLFIFMSTGSGGVSLQQSFEIFHHESYYAPLPEGWSFLAGDEPPF